MSDYSSNPNTQRFQNRETVIKKSKDFVGAVAFKESNNDDQRLALNLAATFAHQDAANEYV
jgi:hypothetical protein